MDWKELIADLMAADMTQVQIAAECGVSQATVSDLRTGKTKSPSFELGNKLVGLHRQHPRLPPAARGVPQAKMA